MGLMTDPYAQAVLSTFIGRFYKVGSLLCYVAGVAYMLALAYPALNAGTYFSENALLPGLVDREYADSSHNVEHLAEEYKKVIDETEGLPVAYLETKFTQLGLDTYTQNFSVNHPFLETEDVGKRRVPKSIRGTNVYAILRAPRIAGTEAIVLMVPYRGGKKAQERGDTQFGIGLMLSLANFFQTKTYWSKDLIFLVVDQEEMGMQAWLEAYQGIPSDYISSSIMHGRSGAIMGAVNIEVGVPRVKRLDLVTEGINGHLPNLDLFNLVVRLCGKEGVQASFQNQVDGSNYHRLTRDGYEKSAKTMLLNMAHQATGRPRAMHGLFLHYHVEAITIRAVAGPKSGSKNMQVVGRVLEGVIRSINNLLERLHQSFFFYVLPNCDRYVSIGLYMPPFALLMMVPLLNGLALWIRSGSISPSPATTDSGEVVPKTDPDVADSFVARPLSAIMPLLIGAAATGALLYVGPSFFTGRLGAALELTPEELVSVGVMALFVGGAMFPHIIRRKTSSAADPSQVAAEWQLLKSFALIWQAVILSAISMMNFSLAFFISVAMVPISAVVKPSSRTPLRILNAGLLLLVSPPALLFLFLAVFNAATASPASDGAGLLSTTLQMSKHALYRAVVDGYLFGNWSYGLATLVVFPNWLMLWLVVWKKV